MYGIQKCQLTYIVRAVNPTIQFEDVFVRETDAYAHGVWPESKVDMLDYFTMVMNENGFDVGILDCRPTEFIPLPEPEEATE